MTPDALFQKTILVAMLGLTLGACAANPHQQSDLARINAERDAMMAIGNRDRR